MKKNFLIISIILFSTCAFSQTTYTFTGNGNWTDASNWSNSTIPPSVLPAGSTINLNPSSGDSCVLNTSQTISLGAYLNIFTGAIFIIRGNMSSNLQIQDSTFTDPRDGQQYPYKTIGTQVWMTKNLNYDAPGSWCYDDGAINCTIYGRLYNWNTAITVAPPGWHLPSDSEWTTLTTFLGGTSIAGNKMKSTTGWLSNNGATNSSGFTGLPGGHRNDYTSAFEGIGYYSSWWSSSEYDAMNAWYSQLLFYYAGAVISNIEKQSGYSVRCVRD